MLISRLCPLSTTVLSFSVSFSQICFLVSFSQNLKFCLQLCWNTRDKCIQLYEVYVHACNIDFFKLTISIKGQCVEVHARVIISAQCVEVVNVFKDVVVDEVVYSIKNRGKVWRTFR